MQVPDFHVNSNSRVAKRLQQIRQAIKQKQCLHIQYRRADDEHSERQIRPLGFFYWGSTWTMVAWCELRDDFRQFRLDRIQSLNLKDHCFKAESGKQLQDYMKGISRND